MSKNLQGYVRPRPIRIAFLLSDGKHADLSLDGIFADSYKRWGGRFSLIVPIRDGTISDAYWDWLEAYDPDIVYSYTSLSREFILALHERIYPAEIMVHRQREKLRLDVHGFKPDYRFSPLDSLATIFHHSRFVRRQVGETAGIIDCWSTENPTRFLTDNFGTYHNSYGGGGWPNDARSAATLKTIINPEKYKDRQFGIPHDLDRFDSELAAFEEFAHNRVSSLSMASIRFAPKLNIHSDRWSSAFNLVIGNSFKDRIMFWNARAFIPDWLDNDLNCLRVEYKQLEDEAFLTILGEFLKRHNHVNAGSGGTSQLMLRSASLSKEEMADIKAKINSTKPWCIVRTEIVCSLDELVPEKSEFKHAREGHRFGTGFNLGPNTKRFTWQAPALKPPSVPPHILEDAPPRQIFIQGYWAMDCELKSGETSIRLGDRNRWHLPRRWRMARIPKFERTHDSFNQTFPSPRSNRLGQLTFCTSVDTVIDSITLPNASEAIYGALTADEFYTQDNLKEGRAWPKPKVMYVEPSNEARYFDGVLDLLGGLGPAANYLLHPFLRKLFEDLGGAQEVAWEKVQPTFNALSKRARHDERFDLNNEADCKALAHLVVKAARGLKSPIEMVSFSSLQKKWDEYRIAYWDRTGRSVPDSDDNYNWEGRERDSLKNCLIALRQKNVLFQGQHFVCEKCHHRNWVDLNEIKAEQYCSICQTSRAAPVTGDWFFRPNEFLIQCLRDRSVLSLVWVLYVLSSRCHSSFYYTGPTKFFYTHKSFEANQPDSEADLLVVADGQTILCEVKSSWSVLRDKDIMQLVSQAKRIRPDLVILAVMAKNKKLNAVMIDAQKTLAKDGIEFDILTWHQDDLLDSPVLRSN